MAVFYSQPFNPRDGIDPTTQYADLNSREVAAWPDDHDLQVKVKADLKLLALIQGLTRYVVKGDDEQPIVVGLVRDL